MIGAKVSISFKYHGEVYYKILDMEFRGENLESSVKQMCIDMVSGKNDYVVFDGNVVIGREALRRGVVWFVIE